MKVATFLIIFSLLCPRAIPEECSFYYRKDGIVYESFPIRFVSNPPGSHIEMDGEYLGQTPLIYNYSGSRGLLCVTTVRATPSEPGYYVQTKEFDGLHRLPMYVFFDLGLKPDKNGNLYKER